MSDHQAARAIRQLRNAERRIRVYRYFKACRSKGTSPKQIHAIKVPTNWPTSKSPNLTSTQLSDPKLAKDWREVKCPQEIEFLIKLRNQRHFGQAEHDKTPFTQEPLRSRLNWSASTGTADLILEGNYSPNDIDDISQLFLTHCKKATALDSLHHLVTL